MLTTNDSLNGFTVKIKPERLVRKNQVMGLAYQWPRVLLKALVARLRRAIPMVRFRLSSQLKDKLKISD